MVGRRRANPGGVERARQQAQRARKVHEEILAGKLPIEAIPDDIRDIIERDMGIPLHQIVKGPKP